MSKIILSVLSLACDCEQVEEYCQVNIDRYSYYITHNLVNDPFEKAYMQGKMDALEGVLKYIYRIN